MQNHPTWTFSGFFSQDNVNVRLPGKQNHFLMHFRTYKAAAKPRACDNMTRKNVQSICLEGNAKDQILN
jgi:hypothetical protein